MKLIPLPPMTFDEALAQVEADAGHWDRRQRWAESDPPRLGACGALRWAIPREFGGEELSPLELHLRYERLAAASVATALVLTRRDAAIGFIESATEVPGRAEWLRQLADGKAWVTTGIENATPDGQRGESIVTATETGDGYRLNGLIPWCTATYLADGIVTDAMTEDGRQVLMIIRRRATGVIDDELPLVALSASRPVAVRLINAMVPAPDVLRGPCDNVLLDRRNGLALGETFLITGLTRAAIKLIERHESDTARVASAQFGLQLESLRSEVHSLCQPGREADAAAANNRIQAACIDLALRATQAAVGVYKRPALTADHPAQRLAREAMFLLGWSSSSPAVDRTAGVFAHNSG